jgi:HAD superfamily hydrolase (TIGR01484 family)
MPGHGILCAVPVDEEQDSMSSKPLPLTAFEPALAAGVEVLFTDIDDTLTTGGRLTADAYAAMEALRDGGLRVVPVTGRPAGWCDHIARMWPVDGVVGENGAFYMRYDPARRRLIRRHRVDAHTRAQQRVRLERLAREILAAVPGTALASDQAYREVDVAIDVSEDVPPLTRAQVQRVVEMFRAAGATAKVSSIHVNGWFGEHDKLSMARVYAKECLDVDLDATRERFAFAGDSPNDAPMFGFFPYSVGVANVARFLDELDSLPRYITEHAGGAGFAELARWLLRARDGQ